MHGPVARRINGGGGSSGPEPRSVCRLRIARVLTVTGVSAQQLPQQTLQHGRGVSGHEEIILVSDGRVLTLRMALPGQ